MLLSENTFYRDYEEAYSTTQGRDSFSCYCYRTHSVKNTFFVKYINDQHKHKKKIENIFSFPPSFSSRAVHMPLHHLVLLLHRMICMRGRRRVHAGLCWVCGVCRVCRDVGLSDRRQCAQIFGSFVVHKRADKQQHHRRLRTRNKKQKNVSTRKIGQLCGYQWCENQSTTGPVIIMVRKISRLWYTNTRYYDS